MTSRRTVHPLITYAYLVQRRSELDRVTREGWRHPEPQRPARLARTRRWLATSLVPREPAAPAPTAFQRAAVTLRPPRAGHARDVPFLAAVNGRPAPGQ